MPQTQFTTQDLLNIEQAIATGQLVVKISDKEITYRSIKELIAAHSFIEQALDDQNDVKPIRQARFRPGSRY